MKNYKWYALLPVLFVVIGLAALLSVTILAAGTPGLDSGFLTKTSFKFSTLISSAEIIFSTDGTYAYEYGSEGLNWYNRGTYSIKNDAVMLMPNFCSSHKEGTSIDCAETMGEALCSLRSRPDDLYYERYFICTSKKNRNALAPDIASMDFPVENSRVRAGASKLYKGIPVVTMGSVKGVTTTNVKIREKPSLKSKARDYIKAPYETVEARQSVPANTGVTVIARTRDRDRVQNWNNYWYLVSLDFTVEVWMYGEFVKLK